MVELAQHIERLLLENDCVIIPDFGGIITHYVSAQRMNGEKSFLPPIRTIGFNPKLKINDGVLVQSYMKTHHVSFSDAAQMMERDVEKLISFLHEKKKFKLSHIGEIHGTSQNTYEFIPYTNSITTPYLYGLDSFEIKEISELNSNRRTERHGIIPVSCFRYAVAIAVVLFLSFFLSPPVENINLEDRNYALLLLPDIFTHSIAIAPITVTGQQDNSYKQAPIATENKRNIEDENVENREPVTEKKTETEAEITTPQTEKAEVTKSVVPVSAKKKAVKRTKYHIIASMADNPRMAQNNMKALKKEGYANAQAITVNRVVCISMMSFSTYEDAYRKLLLLRLHKNYEDAWIMKTQQIQSL
ncbi:hypothetical protein EZS27_010121 [termite gut metagenome]|uniref:SPOR domain-containing protein n=1 Tax=termite gut metagenome TaxID=433724 RepID=A0A5J4S7M0_9ZZZZ